MKSKSVTSRNKPRQIDQRDLINIDLYKHEINVLEDELKQGAAKHKSKGMQNKQIELEKELACQKQKLEIFKKSCEMQQDLSTENTNSTLQKNVPPENEGFFEHLKAFEEEFKKTRNKVNDFLGQ